MRYRRASLGAVQTTREYDDQGRPSRISVSANGSSAFDVRYAYDRLGRITGVTEARAGGKPTQSVYAYDAAGRLTSVSVNGIVVELDGYDAAGNRVSVKTATGTLAVAYNDRQQLQLWGTAQYAFRPDGQLVSVTAASGKATYSFDDFGDLASVTLADGRGIEYLVDAAGVRIGKRIDGKLVAGYLYAPDGTLAAQTDGSGAVVARFGYDDAGRLTLVERGGKRYAVVTDHLGSPLLVIDSASGDVAEAITYDAWGKVTSDTNPGFIPIGFAGGNTTPTPASSGSAHANTTRGPAAGPAPIR